MSYLNLKDYLKQEKTSETKSQLLKYIKLVGADAFAEEAWDEVSFELMRHTSPEIFGDAKMWSAEIEFGDSTLRLNTAISKNHNNYNSYSYHICFDNYVDGDIEKISFPDGQKQWFKKHFTTFIKRYSE